MNSEEKNKGFEVPERYFELSKKKLTEKVAKQHDRNIPSYTLPNAYFEKSKIKILNNISKNTRKKTTVLSLLNYKHVIGVAASLLLLLVISIFNNNTQITEVANKQLKKPILEKKQGIKYSATLSKKDKMLAIFSDDTSSDELIDDFLLNDEIAFNEDENDF